MVCAGRRVLTPLTMVLTVPMLPGDSLPHFDNTCLLERVVAQVQEERNLVEVCSEPGSQALLHNIPVKALCALDKMKLTTLEQDSQKKMNKCCRAARRESCSTEEWRVVLRARYRNVLCQHTKC